MFRIIIISILIFSFLSSISGQGADNREYISLFEKGSFKEALKIIIQKIDAIYEKRVDNKRIPADILSFKGMEQTAEDRKKLNYLFTVRKAEGFFIEENPELSSLHLYAARCYSNIAGYDSSLNHYHQSLRYKQIDPLNDAPVYYEISQVYKNMNHFNAYLNSLESACTMNPANYDYSRELGMALRPTANKKKAIFHLERYIESEGDQLKDKNLYLITGNLYEETGRYLKTAEYYKKYLKFNDTSGHTYFALGYLAFARIGDYELAVQCFNKALDLLPENELYRRAISHEYKGDILMKELDFESAVESYMFAVKYQDKLGQERADREKKIVELNNRIREIKASIISDRTRAFDKYNEYEYLEQEKGKIALEHRENRYELKKLNQGKTRWNIAESLEKLDRLEDAARYYREAIAYNFKSNEAREKIVKLQLKIKRGY